MSALLTISDFKKIYGVSRSTVYRLKDRGEIHFVHIGSAVRIRRDEAEAWCASLSDNEANDA